MNTLAKITGLSSATIAKINKSANINTEVLIRICVALKCDLTDIMRLEENEEQ
ncbi:MAG: helix-turn-helix transcriptional regulator [Firmicutes bacterium]|nr:helix-turn-helix transcriptional regulator [Bacillota bacterium]